MTDVQPEIGDRVTYYDGDGDPHRALVVDACRDAEYVTVATGAQGELGEVYNHDVDAHTSTYPHADLGDEFTAEANAFKPSWDVEG